MLTFETNSLLMIELRCEALIDLDVQVIWGRRVCVLVGGTTPQS